MKILAVSDVESRSLDNLVANYPEKLRSVDIILSCGDLDREYVEFLVDGLNRQLFFVSGNHAGGGDEPPEDYPLSASETSNLFVKIDDLRKRLVRRISGQYDMHGRVEVFGNYLIAGFGGSMWYGGRGNEFTEPQMAKIVKSVERKILLHRLKDKLMRRKPKDLIIISHAPLFGIHDLPDKCHTGFKCFNSLVKAVSPLLWVHGHVHLPDAHRNHITLEGKTTVLNAYGYKFITVGSKKIEVSYRSDILDKQG